MISATHSTLGYFHKRKGNIHTQKNMHKGDGDFVYNSQKIKQFKCLTIRWMDQQYANINGILVSTKMNQPLIHTAYLCGKK